MTRSRTRFGQIALLALVFLAIWPNTVPAAAPVITSLGQIREGLYRPVRIDIDDQANLYISDARLKMIQKWDMYGRQIATFSGFPVNGAFTVTPDGSRLYVCDNKSSAIIDARNGAILGYLGQGVGEFGYAYDIDLDSQGNIYVADGTSLTIRVYNPQGVFKFSFGGRGVTNGTFTSFSALVINHARSEVFVADSSFTDPYYPKVQVFTLDGVWLRSMDSRTAFGKPLYLFGAIAFDNSGRAYFMNGSKSWVSVIDLPTTFRSTYGVEGVGVGTFLAPWDAAWDSVNKRLIVLMADSRLEIFGIDGGANPVNSNVAPGQPVPTGPIGGDEVASATPVLTFANAVDPDGDVLTYNIRLQQNGQNVAEYTGIQQGAGQTSYQIIQALTEDSTYTWSVQANDGRLTSGWSSPQSFSVNAIQAPPTVPVALSPVGGSEVASVTPALTFGNASDPDSAVLTYNVRLFKNGEIFAQYDGIPQGAGQSVAQVAQDLVENASYTWAVQAFDGRLASDWSVPQGFKVNAIEESPSVPAALTPAGGGEIATATPALAFGNASDPDGDTLTYNLRLQQNGQAVAEFSGITQGESQSVYQLSQPLGENATYSWSVQATDGSLSSDWSPEQSFIVNALQEAPGAPALITPASGESVDGSAQFIWAQAIDPDPGDTVGYQLQISDESGFAAVLIEEAVDATSITFADCAAYPDLVEGKTYYWRVLATDNEGFSSEAAKVGSFVYDTTVLTVTANVPGTRIYLGGNYAYAGQYIGEAPLALRDLAAGTYRFVAERVGLESYVSNIIIGERQNIKVVANLIPALAPVLTARVPFTADGQKIVIDGHAAPFVIDLDGDGNLDLVVGNANGVVNFYRGLPSDERMLLLDAGSSLGQFMPGAIPFFADWNNDSRVDLLLGEFQGTVSLYLDQNTSGPPRYTAGQHLAVNGVPIQVGNTAAPAVIDFDGDGDKDLLVGNGSGFLYFYANSGSDEVPLLGTPVQIAKLPAPASYFLSDWNADGRQDLLSADGAVVSVHTRNADGTFAAPREIADLKKNDQIKMLRPFACDYDNFKGKDLFVGAADGQIYLAKGNGKDQVPSLQGALLAKIGQIEELAGESIPEVLALRTAIEGGDYKTARQQGELLRIGAGDDLATALKEFILLLK